MSLRRRAARAGALQPLLGLRQDLRHLKRHLRHFLIQDEWRSGQRLAAPGLVLRGFNSSRAYQYPDRPRRRDGYVSDFAYIRRVASMNPEDVRRDLKDKLRCAEVLHGAGFGDSVPRTYGSVVDGVFTQLTDDVAGAVVIKPSRGSRGGHVSIAADLRAAVADCPAEGAFILQEMLVQDEFRRWLYPGALNTLRVHVIRSENGAAPHVATVVQRMGRDLTAPVDNFSRGGLAASVRVRDGRMTYAVARPTGRRRQTWDRHPDSGAQIAGTHAPGIEQACELALAAMELWPSAVNVGWDIALCDRGPVIVEGNATWPNFGLLQTHGPITGDPVVRRWCQQRGLL